MAQMYETEEYTYHGSIARTNADTDRKAEVILGKTKSAFTAKDTK